MKALTSILVSVSLLLGACGGSSGPSGSDSTQPPASSTSSSSSTTSGSSTSSSSSSSGGSTSSTSSSTTSSSTSSSSGSSSGDAPTLSQDGNPIYGELEKYEDWLASGGDADSRLATDKALADNIISWQMPHGGFYKYDVSKYTNAWNGSEARSGWTGANGVELGTIDNDATVSELMFLADVYQRSGETSYRDAARAALDFLLTMQTDTGGWPQVYPERTGTSYSNHVTFNDNAMARVLILLDAIQREASPLDGDLFSETQRTQVDAAIEAGVDFILNAQIEQGETLTVWCAQHDAQTYEPRAARSYELASKSGKESVLVVAFLMTRPQTEEVETAVKAALAWYRNPEVQVADTAYVKRSGSSSDDNYNPIQARNGSTMWYRFYDLDENTGFFSGRAAPEGEGKQYDIMLIEPERRYGYEWGGRYGDRILGYAGLVGY